MFNMCIGLQSEKVFTDKMLQDLAKDYGTQSDSSEDEEESSQPLCFLDINLLSSSEDDEDEEVVVQAKKRKPAWQRKNEKGETPLHRAAIAGILE